MKTLQSILNNPESRLSAEEMRNLKGGGSRCYCKYTSGDQYIYQAVQGNGTCDEATQALMDYYDDVWDRIECYNL